MQPKERLPKEMYSILAKNTTPRQKAEGFVSYGAEDEIRTRDPRLGKAMLYH